MKRIIVLFLILVVFKSGQGQNLILNPGFENGLTDWLTISQVPGMAQFVVDNSEFHSGSSSGKIVSSLTSTNGAGYLQLPSLEAQETYECSYWVKTDSLEKYLFSFVQFKDVNSNDITQVVNPISSNQSNWQKIQFRFKAPENTANAILSVFVMNQGTLWLDDVSLVKLSDTTFQQYSADLQSTTGTFKNLLGTNVGPVNPFSSQDYSSKFNEIGIDFVRTHDYHIAFDFHVIFPDTSLSPFDSLAYDFSKTDSCVADILNANCNILFRLGESAGGNYNSPPEDNEKWAQVAVQIIKHYNDNWNNGFAYDIKYWEIWNEPDLHEFWTGSLEEYIALYQTAALTIKSYDSSLFVGGPTLAVAYDTKWVTTFLDSISTNNVPLDFFSYHLYDLFNPYNLSKVTNFVKEKLNSYNLTNTELILDEWNPYPYTQLPSNYGKVDALNSASTVSGMHYLQNAPIDKLFRYSTDMLDFPLFNWDNTYTYQGYAYKAIGELVKMGNKIATTGGDSLGRTISAGKSTMGGKSVLLVSDNSSSSTGYNLEINGIQNNEVWNYQITRLDSANEYTIVKTGSLTSQSHLITEQVKSPFVDEIELTRTVLTGIGEQEVGNVIAVFPNPFTKQLTVHTSEPGQATIALYNGMSQLMLKQTFVKECTLSTQHLAAGIYSYVLHQAQGGLKYGKLLKQ